MMIERFRDNLRRLVCEPREYTYLLAVSGGADSCVMAYLFHSAGCHFAIAHCNFHLRGEDSNRDMELVRTMADQLSAPLFLREFDTLSAQRGSGASIEMVARQQRYDWFEEVAREYDFIVTAHNANDVAETMLLNLCRGTGLKGLMSIPERNGKIIRPLLCFSSAEIREFARNKQIPFAVDYTNTDQKYHRNRIRCSVIPELEQLNPNLVETLSKDREIFAKQYRFYEKAVMAAKQDLIKEENNRFHVLRKRLDGYSDRSLLLYEILKDFSFPAEVSEQLLTPKQTGRCFFSPTHVLTVNREEYIIQSLEQMEYSEILIPSLEELKHYFQVEYAIVNGPIEYPKDNNSLFLPLSKLVFPLLLRNWREGDYFYPLGGKGKRKLSDFFTDQKVDRYAKHQIKLLCSEGNIIWIVGMRSDQRYRIGNNDREYYKISIIENGTDERK